MAPDFMNRQCALVATPRLLYSTYYSLQITIHSCDHLRLQNMTNHVNLLRRAAARKTRIYRLSARPIVEE